jgi:hypothetical protein
MQEGEGSSYALEGVTSSLVADTGDCLESSLTYSRPRSLHIRTQRGGKYSDPCMR